MEQIIDVLNERNQQLELFVELNARNLPNFQSGDFNDLEDFYKAREVLIDLIQRLDRRVDEIKEAELESQPDADQLSRFKVELDQALESKTILIETILDQDLYIIECIEKAKNEIIKDLNRTRSSRRTLNGYRSFSENWTFDEEA